MKRLAAIALLLAAFGALLHFWPSSDPSAVAPPSSADAPPLATKPRAALTFGQETPQPSYPTQGPASAPATALATAEGPAAGPARIDIRAPQTVASGETFSVTIEVQAPRGIRQLEFSVTYKMSILQLVKSSAGPFAQQGGSSAHFEEVSDGSLLVRIAENGVIAGAGSVAVLEFQALKRGVSPLAVEGVTYIEDGRRGTVNRPTAYEGSIAVE